MGGVGVISNSSSNLFMNLWNLASATARYYSWLKLGMSVFSEMPTLNFPLLNEDENKH